jgi:hypothetical protein
MMQFEARCTLATSKLPHHPLVAEPAKPGLTHRKRLPSCTGTAVPLLAIPMLEICAPFQIALQTPGKRTLLSGGSLRSCSQDLLGPPVDFEQGAIGVDEELASRQMQNPFVTVLCRPVAGPAVRAAVAVASRPARVAQASLRQPGAQQQAANEQDGFAGREAQYHCAADNQATAAMPGRSMAVRLASCREPGRGGEEAIDGPAPQPVKGFSRHCAAESGDGRRGSEFRTVPWR